MNMYLKLLVPEAFFQPKMHQIAFGGRALPGPAGGASVKGLISALPLSTHSAVEMLHDSALYQFMIDMTLSFENSQTVNCNKIQNFGHFVELEIRVATKDKDYMQLKLLSTDLPLC